MLAASCGQVLAHNLSSDGAELFVTFLTPEAADAAVSMSEAPAALSLLGPLPSLRIERRKADPKSLLASSSTIVLKNLAYDIRTDALREFLSQFAGVPPPVNVDLHFESGQFRGVAFAKYSSVEDARRVMHKVHMAQFGGRTVKAEVRGLLGVSLVLLVSHWSPSLNPGSTSECAWAAGPAALVAHF